MTERWDEIAQEALAAQFDCDATGAADLLRDAPLFKYVATAIRKAEHSCASWRRYRARDFSPIEKIFAATTMFVTDGYGQSVFEFEGQPFEQGPPSCVMVPQYEWSGHRFDFAFLLDRGDKRPYVTTPELSKDTLFIECDGHEFHERTKHQAKRDRSLDRAVQAAGFRILRFTGSELWNNHNGAREQVESTLYDMMTYLIMGRHSRQRMAG